LSGLAVLRPYIHQRDPDSTAAPARATPVSYLIFDVLHVNDTSDREQQGGDRAGRERCDAPMTCGIG
jgi:hypothetical protein